MSARQWNHTEPTLRLTLFRVDAVPCGRCWFRYVGAAVEPHGTNVAADAARIMIRVHGVRFQTIVASNPLPRYLTSNARPRSTVFV